MLTAARILGTRLWYRHLLSRLAITKSSKLLDALDASSSKWNSAYGIDERGPPSWECGEKSVSMGIARRVESQIVNTEYVLIVSVLLSPCALTAPAARRAVQRFYFQQLDDTRLWELPPPGLPPASCGEVVRYAWEDSASLALRGDFPGLLAILALLREAVAGRDFARSRQFAQDLYTALPSVCGQAWVKPDVDLILQCIEEMMSGRGIRWLPCHIRIDWDVFRAQMQKPATWCGTPPWILTGHAVEGGRATIRPVPLFEDIEPLHPWVRRPATRQGTAKRSPKGFGFFEQACLLKSTS